MDSKVCGIISYITIFGWIVAVVTNNPKSDFASFHIRQMLGLMLTSVGIGMVSFVFIFIPFVGWMISLLCWLAFIVLFVFWVLGFIGALQGEMNKVPVFGDQFQQWFAAL